MHDGSMSPDRYVQALATDFDFVSKDICRIISTIGISTGLKQVFSGGGLDLKAELDRRGMQLLSVRMLSSF